LIATLAHTIIAIIGALGYAGIAGLMAIESACVPIPSELIMPFGGYLVSTHRLTLVGVTLAGALGCNVGSTLAYLVGATGGRRFILRYGRYLLISQTELARVEIAFARYGAISVLLGRLLPIVRTYISLPAGIARMNFWKFQFYSFVGSMPWCFALAYAGLRAGRAWNTSPLLQSTMHGLSLVTAAALFLAAAWYLSSRWRRWRAAQAQLEQVN
jgi:membrane protein DedA with SNARE-associated domain